MIFYFATICVTFYEAFRVAVRHAENKVKKIRFVAFCA